MSLWEDAWDADNKRHKENYEKNMECFEKLSDKEKFDLMWKEYVNNHCNDVGLHEIISRKR
ncbi:MAG: hypothetical protein IJE43_19840 [Alphaproteobacteria bacterium]|nr:hypothetical protein [Alphaproteobacteria bacterium]